MAVSKETLEKHLIQVRRIAEHREAKAEQNIRYYFAKLKKDLNSFLGNEYAKLAEDDKLTYAILQQKGEYARFLEEVTSKVDGISPKLRSEVQSLVEETYKTCYKGLVKGVEGIDDMESLAKEFKAISAISPETVKRAVQNPIKKLTLNSTLERNRKQVISNIRREINIGLTQGDRMSTMANRISKHVEQDYRKSMLIARTEAHRVRESGFNDAAESVDTILTENDSEFRMVKTWRNMRDGAVRHTNLANHVEMEGVTVLQDEDFELSDGSHAPCPGSSGIAAQDCNCRCYLSRRIMNDEEYYKETGKHFSAKAFTNQGKRDIINSVDSCTDFEELSTYFDSKYEILVDDSVKSLDFDLVKPALRGVESVFTDYPDLPAVMEKVVTGKAGIMSCSGENITFNPHYFSHGSNLPITCVEQSQRGFWPKNSSVDSIGAHEAGHGVEYLLIKSNAAYTFDFEKVLAWNQCSEAKVIVSQACKNIKQTAYGKGKRNAELISAISKYASSSASETMAEAFADVYANGKVANPLSIEIKKLTERTLKKYKGGS